jgi:RNA polymerase sigma-70 factor (ECF subfamily)
VDLETIIRDCLDGKQGAWNMLVDLYSKKVFNMAYQFAGSVPEAEDLTQDIFLKLHGALPKYDFGKSFTAWFLTLAKNTLIDEYRRTKWEKRQRDEFDERLHAAADGDDPERALAREEARKLLWAGLDALPPDMRLAVILKEIQGKKYEDVAEILGLPVGTVKSRINRGRLQLAKILRDRPGIPEGGRP